MTPHANQEMPGQTANQNPKGASACLDRSGRVTRRAQGASRKMRTHASPSFPSGPVRGIPPFRGLPQVRSNKRMRRVLEWGPPWTKATLSGFLALRGAESGVGRLGIPSLVRSETRADGSDKEASGATARHRRCGCSWCWRWRLGGVAGLRGGNQNKAGYAVGRCSSPGRNLPKGSSGLTAVSAST